jgi:hypothetical protein
VIAERRDHALQRRRIERQLELVGGATDELPLGQRGRPVDRRRDHQRVQDRRTHRLRDVREAVRPVELVVGHARRDERAVGLGQGLEHPREDRGLFLDEATVGGEHEPHALDEQIDVALAPVAVAGERRLQRALVAEIGAHRLADVAREPVVRDRRRRDAHDRHDVPEHALAEQLRADRVTDLLALDLHHPLDQLFSGRLVVLGLVLAERERVEAPESLRVVGVEADPVNLGEIEGHLDVQHRAVEHLSADSRRRDRHRPQRRQALRLGGEHRRRRGERAGRCPGERRLHAGRPNDAPGQRFFVAVTRLGSRLRGVVFQVSTDETNEPSPRERPARLAFALDLDLTRRDMGRSFRHLSWLPNGRLRRKPSRKIHVTVWSRDDTFLVRICLNEVTPL